MGILKIFDTAELEQFATSLADDLTRRFPPASEARTWVCASRNASVCLRARAASRRAVAAASAEIDCWACWGL